METITLEEFRCFHERQSARMAPLTLLVGDNSTGKTSFMAMIRALLDLAVGSQIPDFKEEPHDLGSFDEIVHNRGGRSGRAEAFEGGFEATWSNDNGQAREGEPYHFEVTFKKKGTTPIPVRRRLACGITWFEEQFDPGHPHILQVGTSRGSWERQLPPELSAHFGANESPLPAFIFF